MADESILVVDDVQVNLKLTDILLRREGFKVHTSSDAEQALALLRGFHPDLMLVDIELPGMDGLSLTRRVKQNPSTRDIVVIALSARASTGDDKKAYEAGCDGYLTKPVDSATLISSIREHLFRPVPMQPITEEHLVRYPGSAEPEEEDLETLRRRFLEEAALQCRQMLESLHKNFDVPKAARLMHQWVGAAGILGYLPMSNLAREAEETLNGHPLDVGRMRELISDLLLGFQKPLESEPQPIPPSVRQALSTKPFGLVGFGAEDTERVCAALEMVGARPRLFRALDPLDSGTVRDCSAILVYVCPETISSHWLANPPLLMPTQPLVLAGRREQIMSLDNSVQTRASEFLIDGWQPEEALMRLNFAISRPTAAGPVPHNDNGRLPELRLAPSNPKVVIADDDPTVRSLVKLTLQEYGMECFVASNGSEALQLIRERDPQAAVLDVNMPGMDGYLVLAALREERRLIQVVLLTARKHENDISRGFNLGADDYVVKPFNPVELVARLKRLLRR